MADETGKAEGIDNIAVGMIQNLGEKAEAELVKLYQQIYTKGTRGEIADRRKRQKSWFGHILRGDSHADSERRQNDWQTGGRKEL